MRFIVDKDARVSIRGTTQFLPRGWIVTDEPPPRKPGWLGGMVQTGTVHLDEGALKDLLKSGAPLTEVDETVPMENCPHCGKHFVSNFAPPPGAESEPNG